MYAKISGCRTLGVLVVVTSVIILATGNTVMAGGIVAPQSDEMVISLPGIPPLFDNLLIEPPPTGVEIPLTFAGGPANVVPPPAPLAAVIGLPGTSVVVLTEPVGTVPDPGEVPIIIPGPNRDVVVSDIVISTIGNQAGAPPFITLVSDGGPDLAQLVPLLPVGTVFIEETGLFQDLTGVLAPAGSPFGPITVLVRSDVPEPSGIVLAALGLVGAIVWRLRRRKG
jgi:hypothetical protein